MTSFKALITREDAGKFTTTLEQRDTADLPQNEVLVRVKYSSLNYKDALSSAGHKGITKEYPHTPGIDAAGLLKNQVLISTKRAMRSSSWATTWE